MFPVHDYIVLNEIYTDIRKSFEIKQGDIWCRWFGFIYFVNRSILDVSNIFTKNYKAHEQ